MEFDPVVTAGVAMLLLLFLKVPVFSAVLSASVVYFTIETGVPTKIIAQRITSGVQSVTLLAVPFFICAGVLMNYSGVTRRIMAFAEVLTGRMYGGLAQVNIVLSTLMGGLSGSSLADAAMQAKMIVPEMRAKGISNEFSSVITGVSAMITPLIPPGIAMIIYGSIANVSIGKLFVAGIGPGLLLCLSMMTLTSRISRKRNYPRARERALTGAEIAKVIREAILPLCLPVLIIGGIRFGVFTATEAGSFALVYALVLGLLYREINLKIFFQAIRETIVSTSAIMLIVGAASGFAWILTREQIPQAITDYVVSVIDNKYLFLFVVNMLLIFIGMFIEGNAAMIVLVPLLAPVANMYNIDPIQFGMVFIFNMAIGSISPPMGTLMFVTCGITRCKIQSFMSEAFPYYILLFICLMLLSYVPFFTTGLVNMVYPAP